MGGMAVCPSCPKFYTFNPDEIVNNSVDAKKKKNGHPTLGQGFRIWGINEQPLG